MQPPSRDAKPEDIDVAALGRALWRAKTWIISLSILAGLVTFVGLSMVRPLYTSEARVLIENDTSPFNRTATDQGRDNASPRRAGGAEPGPSHNLARPRPRSGPSLTDQQPSNLELRTLPCVIFVKSLDP